MIVVKTKEGTECHHGLFFKLIAASKVNLLGVVYALFHGAVWTLKISVMIVVHSEQKIRQKWNIELENISENHTENFFRE